MAPPTDTAISEFDAVQAAASAVRRRWPVTPRALVVLGSGLGALARDVESPTVIPFEEVPHLAPASADGHAGRLVCGKWAGVDVIVQQGRLHLYEGHSPRQAALPVRIARALGADALLTVNAAGGLNPQFRVGDLMLIDDHVNLMFDNPLIGMNDDRVGPRFPDMSAPYDPSLQQTALQIAQREGIPLHRGVYVAVLGPNYETRAEYRMCRTLGADAVGMSTVPEVLVARHAGMKVLGLSAITNVGSPDAPTATAGHDVIANAAATMDKVGTILRSVVAQLGALGPQTPRIVDAVP